MAAVQQNGADMQVSRTNKTKIILVFLVLIVILSLCFITACGKNEATAIVEREDIRATVCTTGAIIAVNSVEIDSRVIGQTAEAKEKNIKKIRKRLRDILGKVSLVLVLALNSIYFLRVANKALYNNNQSSVLKAMNERLRKYHKLFGFLVVLLGMLHGILSKTPIFSMNWGSLCWVLSIMLAANCTIKDKLRLPKPWIYYHRILAFIFMLALCVHFFSED